MGLPAGHDHLEAEPLKLTVEQFPLPCSLLKAVLERYSNPPLSQGDEQAMPRSELLAYLKNAADSDLPPLDAVLAQTEAIGDPAVPNGQQTSILRWLSAAQKDWESRYPLEEPLASILRPLRPVLAGLAISDPDFLTPGAHPMHQIMDTIHESGVGWQPRLGRAGQALQRQLTQVVEKVTAWFDDNNLDLEAICAELRVAVERDRTRSHRMAQRVIETEQGRIKTAEARLQAARMINEVLEKYPAPTGIGEFLKDHWYASAQLVLLKHGADSEEWQSMSATTTRLLESLQPPEDDSDEHRQQTIQLITQLPKDLRRWLLNLHHDSEAVSDAVGLIEFAHLRVLRQQSLSLEPVAPIPLPEEPAVAESQETQEATAQELEPGQWFRIVTSEGDMRVQLALKLEQEKQLLFTNQAGLKALQQSYDEFTHAMYRGQVVALESGASYSACLAAAAGIKTLEDLETFTGANARAQQEEQAARERLEQEKRDAERWEEERREAERLEARRREAERVEQERLVAERRERERQEAERLERERQEAERLEREREETQRLEEERGESQVPDELDDERLQQEWESARRAQEQQAENERRQRQEASEEVELGDAEELEQAWEKARQQREAQEAEERRLQQLEAERVQLKEAEELERAWDLTRQEREDQDAQARSKVQEDQPRKETREPGEAGSWLGDTDAPEAAAAEDQARIEAYLRQKEERRQRRSQDSLPEQAPAQEAEQQGEREEQEEVVLNLPMGAWLGFHDGDTPLLAKLAVHDREQDQYFFVNREGIKMRQLKKTELLDLLERGLVDILETSSSFRQEVTRIRGKLDD